MTYDLELPESVRAHRDWLLAFVPAGDGLTLVDLGCSTGNDLNTLGAKTAAPSARFVGVDSSERSVATASERAGHEHRASFLQHHLGDELPFDTASFDIVYSSNLMECLRNPSTFAREVDRILRPGGTVICRLLAVQNRA
jgi:ubiquinone/menaquinone biosynthesis C-methylase UbiE